MVKYKITNAEWLEFILEVLQTFSDSKFQEKIWLKGEMPEKFSGSFSESVAGLFDDLHFDDFIKIYDKEKYCTADQFCLLKKFHDELSNYLDEISSTVGSEVLLADPEWEKIQLLAKNTLRKFNKKTKIL